MATSDCSAVTFLDIRNDTFVLHVGGESEVDGCGDAFTDSFQWCTHYLKCKDKKFLYLNAEGRFQLEDLNENEKRRLGCKFIIHLFNNTNMQPRTGRAAMLYVNKDGKKMVACCRNNYEVYPEAMDLPPEITECQHKALFYMSQLSSDKYQFESTLYPSKFLGFEDDEHNSFRKVVVLREKGADDRDDDAEVILTEK